MVDFSKKRYENNDIEVIVRSTGTLWLNEKQVEQKLGHKYLPVITDKYDPVYKKHRYELVDKPKKQPNRRFLRSDLALKVIMDCRADEPCNPKRNLGFRVHNVINTKEQTVKNSIKAAFEGENIQTQCSVLGYRIDLYFHKQKLAIKVDELAHAERNLSYEIERQKVLGKELDCEFIRINPDRKSFNIFKEINKIHRHIKKSIKKSLADDLSKRLLELEFRSNHSIRSKCLKWIIKKMLNTL